MATRQPEYTKGGVVIQCDTSVLPRPRPQLAWPIPVFPATTQSFLTLALQTVTGSGTKAILVTTPAVLPGTSAGVWTLNWYSYQGGTPPASPALLSLPVPSAGLGTGLILTPPNNSTVVCYLQRVEAGQVYTYAQATITTPADTTLTTLANAATTAAAALPATAQAVDSAKLGGVPAASYALATSVPNMASPGTIGGATAGLAWFTTVNATTAYKVGGTQVLGSQQAGLGATLASTHCGATYTTTEQGLINALIDKIVLLETKLKAHGLVAT